MIRIQTGFVAATIGLLVLLANSAMFLARAQESTTESALVYGINAAIPGGFVGTFAPPSVDTIYLLDGQTSVISPRLTDISFWPITNEYRANWNARNEPMPGTLEISRDGSMIAEVAPTDYTIHVTPKEGTPSAELFLGPEAATAEERFRARQAAFQEASSAYREAELEWIDAVATATARQQEGQTVEPPPPPEMPDPIGVFSNGLNQGFPIALEPGAYDIRLRDADGQTVPESEKSLVVFAPRRTGVGYTVVPETRWTTPLESPSPSDVIAGEAASTLFLEPHQAREYPAREWALLNEPQRSAADVGGWEWVNGELLVDGVLEIVAGDHVIDQRTLTPFTVRQFPGSQLGYEVIEFDAAAASSSVSAPQAPDFVAFPLHLDEAGEQFQVRVATPEGELLSGSERQISVPTNPPFSRLLLLPIVPLVLGAMAIANRRRRASLPRDAVV